MRIDYRKLTDCVAEVFTAAGMRPEDASWTAECLVKTSAKGVYSHGVHLITGYVNRLTSGMVNVDGSMSVVRETAGTARIDGNNGVGQAVMRDAMKLAIAKAKETGSAVVTGTNIQHYGAGLVYADMAVEAGCIVSLYANAKAQVTPFGSKKPFYGTNPMTWGVPAGKYPAYILDMACSVGAWNKLSVMHNEGRPAPDGWGVDRNGDPTNDPYEIMYSGALLPFGGVKGSGLAGVANFFSGIASGAAKDVYDLYVTGINNYGMIIQLFDIEALMSMEEFSERIEFQIGELLSLEPADESRPVVYPGYLEAKRLEKALAEGVDVADSIAEEIIAAGDKVGIDVRHYFGE